jgi:methanogenic corrinoid protein MtbC1
MQAHVLRDKLLAELAVYREQRQKVLLGGGAPTYDDYKHKVGYLQALNDVTELVNKLVAEINR